MLQLYYTVPIPIRYNRTHHIKNTGECILEQTNKYGIQISYLHVHKPHSFDKNLTLKIGVWLIHVQLL
jgi:hypothetical protein